MRRSERHTMNGALLGCATGLVLDLCMQWLEHKQKCADFTWASFDGHRAAKNAAIGGLIGAAAGYSVYKSKINEESHIRFYPENYLKKVLLAEHLKSNPDYFNKVLKYRNEVKAWLAYNFRDKLAAPPEDSGSFRNKTAIASNYDLDIILAFKRLSYQTLGEMYYDVFEQIGTEFGSRAKVFKQSKTIGVTFEENLNLHFDIVPGREISNYSVDKKLTLYRRPTWIWEKDGTFKTNIAIQQSFAVNRPEARAIIKLMKIYRDRNGQFLPSLVIEQCVVEALSKSKQQIHFSMFDKLLVSMKYISKKLAQERLIDLANSNNDLHKKFSWIQRFDVSEQLKSDVIRTQQNPRFLKEIFET